MGDFYGPDVEFRIEEEDREPITKPLIQQQSVKPFSHRIPIFRDEFIFELMNEDHAIRNVAIIGHFFHGKTTFVDCLLSHLSFDPKKFTDSLFLEQKRNISIKASPVSLTMQSSRDKSYLMNIIDTPGHVQFSDEVTSALRLSDGLVLVVDAADGTMFNTERLLKHALQQNQSITLCINKIDRLILELRLPPNDAYHKLKHIIDEVNGLIKKYSNSDEIKLLSPLLGNVCFASSKYAVCFSLNSFAKLYIKRSKTLTDHKKFARKLWGDIYKVSVPPSSYKFVNNPPVRKSKRSFVEFILEPLYKLFRVTIESPCHELVELAQMYDIVLPKRHKSMNVQPLLKEVCAQFFGPFQSFVDMCVEFIPSPKDNSVNKIPIIWSGPCDAALTKALYKCDPKYPLIVQIVRQYLSLDGSTFHVFGQVLSGTIHAHSEVRVLGEYYTEMDEQEHSSVMSIGRLWLHNSRFDIEVKSVPAGNWVLIEGIELDEKTCTIVDANFVNDKSVPLYVFKPLKFNTRPIVKIAVEPKHPSERPKMLEGLRKCSKSYPILQTKVEESVEHVIIGTGELHLDCVMHDFCRIFTEIEIRISDPVVCFSETVISMSEHICVDESPNKKNIIKMIAEPLEPGLANDLEEGKLTMDTEPKRLARFLKKNYNWDDLSCRSIWAFGPEVNPSNVLLNETSSDDDNSNKLLSSIKHHIIDAFQWATRQGPLCEEPIRGVKFKLIYAEVAKEMVHRSGGQIIPTVRSVCHQSFLKATPRLMEPCVSTQIIAPRDVFVDKNILEEIIVEKRRGRITEGGTIAKQRGLGIPIPGSVHYLIKALMPAIDTFGFEVDVRAITSGQAFCHSVFDRWEVVPGDPLDKGIDKFLVPLEPQHTKHLAREFLLKTRRRKGLPGDVNIEN